MEISLAKLFHFTSGKKNTGNAGSAGSWPLNGKKNNKQKKIRKVYKTRIR